MVDGYVESMLASNVVGQLGGVAHGTGDGHVRPSAAEVALWRAASRRQTVCGAVWRAAAERNARGPEVVKGDPVLLRGLHRGEPEPAHAEVAERFDGLG